MSYPPYRPGHHTHHPPAPWEHLPPAFGPPAYTVPPQGPSYYLPPPPPMPYYPPPPTMMIPTQEPSHTTYITNFIHQNQPRPPPATSEPTPPILELTESNYERVQTTSTLAAQLGDRAVVAGHEGWDGSPLWVIRAWHLGNLIPGKLSVRHSAAFVSYEGKDKAVQNIEVLCAEADKVKWVPASNGLVPANPVYGGHTASGEPFYVGRGRYQMSLTPGKVQPSKQDCCISFAGSEVSLKTYEVLCRV